MLKLFAYLLVAALFAGPTSSAALAQTAQERKAITLDASTYDAYVGQYELTPEFIITIRRSKNGLSLQATDQPEFEIFAESQTKFFLTVVDAQITFVKNEKGEVTHLILHQNGMDQKAVRKNAPASGPPEPEQKATPTPAPPAAVRRPIDLPVEMTVPLAPTSFKGDGKVHLVYELHLTNFLSQELTLTKLEVTAEDGRSLARYEGEELSARLARPGMPRATEKQRVGAGMRAVTYLWLTFDSPSAVPKGLHHNLTARIDAPAESGGPLEISGKGAETTIRNGQTLVLSPPLRGDGWLAANGPSNSSGHRRALIPVGGAAQIAQRFAIDWVQLREDGKTWTGDQLKNENYRCYGAEALAVADATVVAVKDGIPENIPGATSRAVPITLETVSGNLVILDLGQGQYAFYAHLQPGSLRVKAGDKVKRGQVLGLVGNSGNSTEPHLHFHTSNKNSPLSSEGVPYVFDSFEVQGKGWGWKPSGTPVEKRQLEMPLQDNVVRFVK
jgi:murein DD-endopeptidase